MQAWSCTRGDSIEVTSDVVADVKECARQQSCPLHESSWLSLALPKILAEDLEISAMKFCKALPLLGAAVSAMSLQAGNCHSLSRINSGRQMSA